MGGSTEIQQPSPPQPQSFTSTMGDYISNYPAMMQLQQQYAPQEAALNVQLAQQYAQPLGQAYLQAQQAMYPTETAITEALNRQIQEGMGSNVPDWMKNEYLSNMASLQGSNVQGGIGMNATSLGLMQMKQDWQNYYRNLGLSVTGRQPIYGAQQPQYTNQLANYQPGMASQYAASTYSPYASSYANMYGTNANMPQGNYGGVGSLVGAGIGGLTAMALPGSQAFLIPMGASLGGGFGSQFGR